jgi:flagellar motor switch protein FliN
MKEQAKDKMASRETAGISRDLIKDVEVVLEARLGHRSMALHELMALTTGDVVSLDAALAEDVGLYLNGNLIACGEIVAVDERFGVRVRDIVSE